MPVRWRIYIILNFLLAIPALFLLILLIIQFSTGRFNPDNKLAYLLVGCLPLLIIVLNNFFGIVLFQWYYAGTRLLPLVIKRINIVLLILTWMVILLLVVVTGYGVSEELGPESEELEPAGKIAVFVLSFIVILQAAILVMQAKLSNLIQRNNRENMQDMIDGIGQ